MKSENEEELIKKVKDKLGFVEYEDKDDIKKDIKAANKMLGDLGEEEKKQIIIKAVPEEEKMGFLKYYAGLEASKETDPRMKSEAYCKEIDKFSDVVTQSDAAEAKKKFALKQANVYIEENVAAKIDSTAQNKLKENLKAIISPACNKEDIPKLDNVLGAVIRSCAKEAGVELSFKQKLQREFDKVGDFFNKLKGNNTKLQQFDKILSENPDLREKLKNSMVVGKNSNTPPTSEIVGLSKKSLVKVNER